MERASLLVVLYLVLAMKLVMSDDGASITMVGVEKNSMDETVGIGQFIHVCGGTLVTASVVFTGCSCVTKRLFKATTADDLAYERVELLDPDQIRVYAGVSAASTGTNSKKQVTNALALSMHPLCEATTYAYNYGLIKTTNAFRLENGLTLSRALTLDMSDFEKRMNEYKGRNCWTETWLPAESSEGDIANLPSGASQEDLGDEDNQTSSVVSEESSQEQDPFSGEWAASLDTNNTEGESALESDGYEEHIEFEEASHNEKNEEESEDVQNESTSDDEHKDESTSDDEHKDEYASYNNTSSEQKKISGESTYDSDKSKSNDKPIEKESEDNSVGSVENLEASEGQKISEESVSNEDSGDIQLPEIDENDKLPQPASNETTAVDASKHENNTAVPAEAGENPSKLRDDLGVDYVNIKMAQARLPPKLSLLRREKQVRFENHKLMRVKREENDTNAEKNENEGLSEGKITPNEEPAAGQVDIPKDKVSGVDNTQLAEDKNVSVEAIKVLTNNSDDSGLMGIEEGPQPLSVGSLEENSDSVSINSQEMNITEESEEGSGGVSSMNDDKGDYGSGEKSEKGESGEEDVESADAGGLQSGSPDGEGSELGSGDGEGFESGSGDGEGIESGSGDGEGSESGSGDGGINSAEDEFPSNPTTKEGILPEDDAEENWDSVMSTTELAEEPESTIDKATPKRVAHLPVMFYDWKECNDILCAEDASVCDTDFHDTKWCLGAQEQGVQLCMGDTGSPVYCENSLVALLSEDNLVCPESTNKGVAVGLDGAFEYIKATIGMPDFQKEVAQIPRKVAAGRSPLFNQADMFLLISSLLLCFAKV